MKRFPWDFFDTTICLSKITYVKIQFFIWHFWNILKCCFYIIYVTENHLPLKIMSIPCIHFLSLKQSKVGPCRQNMGINDLHFSSGLYAIFPWKPGMQF